MDISIVNQNIKLFIDNNGFLEISTVTGSQEIIQRLEKRTRLNISTHKPRPLQGHPWQKVFHGEVNYKVLESSIYEDLITDPDIEETTLSVTVRKDGVKVIALIEATLKNGDKIKQEVS